MSTLNFNLLQTSLTNFLNIVEPKSGIFFDFFSDAFATGCRWEELTNISRFSEHDIDTIKIQPAKGNSPRYIEKTKLSTRLLDSITNNVDIYSPITQSTANYWLKTFLESYPVFSGDKQATFYLFRYYNFWKLKEEGSTDQEIADYMGETELASAEGYIYGMLTAPNWDIGQGLKIEFTVAGTEAERTITLPLINGGIFDFIVKWGDGNESQVTAHNDANRIHTYQNDGTYVIEIIGEMDRVQFFSTADRPKVTDIIYWGDPSKFKGFSAITRFFYMCRNLKSCGSGSIIAKPSLANCNELFTRCDNANFTSIHGVLFKNLTMLEANTFSETFRYCDKIKTVHADLFKYCTNLKTNPFFLTFANCTALEAVPAGFFDSQTKIETSGFWYTFFTCTKLASIPAKLFDKCTLLTSQAFSNTFRGCYILASIPADLFKFNTEVTTNAFTNTFYDCRAITTIPTDLFKFNTKATTNAFSGTFRSCLELTSIPAVLFKHNTEVSTNGFSDCFRQCTKLEAVPADLFRYNTKVSGTAFNNTFYWCTILATVPDLLFAYNSLATNFAGCFFACNKLQINPLTFYAAGGESTRFLNQSINFSNCFNRSSFTGIQGTAPELWNCDFGTGTPISTNCFAGLGNSAISISNYADIDSGWK